MQESGPNNQKPAHSFSAFTPQVTVASPGRINLIGEHTDYNHGFVMPTAIDKKIFFRFRKNNTPSTCNVYSETFDSGFSFDLNRISKSSKTWENYILGVINELQIMGKNPGGFDCMLRSELPIGAGISSSAALECGLASGLNQLFALGLSEKEIVFLSQAAENNFVGSNCGVMDQYASVMSKKDHLILLDCLSMETEYIPAEFPSCKMLLVNSMVSHSLADGEYNTRRRECETALEVLRTHFEEVDTLRDVDMDMLLKCKKDLTQKQFQRVQYVLEENDRVLTGCEYLRVGQLEDFGELMYGSHYGLKDLYEVSCKELDFLVKFTEDKKYIYGSRMMGGGFGGCTINLIEENKIEQFKVEVTTAYEKEFGITPDLITVVPAEGTIVTAHEE